MKHKPQNPQSNVQPDREPDGWVGYQEGDPRQRHFFQTEAQAWDWVQAMLDSYGVLKPTTYVVAPFYIGEGAGRVRQFPRNLDAFADVFWPAPEEAR